MTNPTAPKPQQPAPAPTEKPPQYRLSRTAVEGPLPMYSPSAREAARRLGYEPFAYTERN